MVLVHLEPAWIEGGLKEDGGRAEESRVELTENRIILSQLRSSYSTLLPSIQTDH